MSDVSDLQLHYLGWSGFWIVCPGGAELYIDPPPDYSLPLDRETHVLITHGHPEHIAAALEHLCKPARKACHVAASPRICRYMRRRSDNAADQFTICEAQQRINFAGLGIDIFQWQHMPLLPPGIRPALHHIKSLISHPALALRIIVAGLRGPLPWPMLGFRIEIPDAPAVLVYGEGLHRHTGQANARRVASCFPAQVLLVAVEPEDTDMLPELIDAIGAKTVGLYQAHEQWRLGFSLPCADLDALASVLEEHGRQGLVFRSGTTHQIAI